MEDVQYCINNKNVRTVVAVLFQWPKYTQSVSICSHCVPGVDVDKLVSNFVRMSVASIVLTFLFFQFWLAEPAKIRNTNPSQRIMSSSSDSSEEEAADSLPWREATHAQLKHRGT